MTLPTPREAARVLGHEAAFEKFRVSFESDRLHHAWLISGPAGIGKATFAFRLARLLLEAEDLSRPAGKRVTAGTHGDLLVIGRKTDPKKGHLRAEITVADVQPLQSFLHHTATEGGWRVVIVDGLEYLNRFAANALLKILEEPPPRAVLLLTTATPGALLPTLRSRCRPLVLSALPPEIMQTLLPDVPKEIIERSHGSPGRALFLARDRDGAVASLVQAALEGKTPDTALWRKLGSVARETDGFDLFCDLLAEKLAERAKTEIRHGALAQAASSAQKTAALNRLRRECGAFNLDKGQAVREAFFLGALG